MSLRPLGGGSQVASRRKGNISVTILVLDHEPFDSAPWIKNLVREGRSDFLSPD